MADPLFDRVLALADDHLILGHRLSEWCGHAPMLEEDLALPNIALDLIGQARALYTYAGTLEGKGRDEDALAYLRLERDYRNLLICERPNGDFAHTMLRQLFFSAFMDGYWQAMPEIDATLHGIAAKAAKETRYHLRHSAEWVIRLGDGTEESTRRTRDAREDLWPYVPELFVSEAGSPEPDERLPDRGALQTHFTDTLRPIFDAALLPWPDMQKPQPRGRNGIHTEDMGPLLAELQYVQRAHPGLTW
ncbi:1,2-phenylacetyl-CoA epoxidase subunit PaaC [Pseudaestuariivita sp.]|uniref:1,2-phenylacetyl-CoA epoxidase subunit PaaC n=1 Tax=Pseudaestuariivita sp. TaxID=2211669 RepID=UPI004057F37D